MHAFRLFLAALALIAFAVLIITYRRSIRRRDTAKYEHYLLKEKISWHMLEDDLSLKEWYDLIPVCRFADRNYEEFAGRMIGNSCEHTLRQFLHVRNDGDEALV